MFFKRLFFPLLIGLVFTDARATEQSFKANLSKIIVPGLSKISEVAVARVLPVSVGKQYEFFDRTADDKNLLLAGSTSFSDPVLAQNIIRSVLSMGYFTNNASYSLIKNSIGEVELEIKVEEKPLLGNVKFFGNKHFGSEKLTKLIKANISEQALVFFDEFDMYKAINKIESLYRTDGYLAANVKGTLTKRGQYVDVEYEVSEGSSTRVQKINFHGCKSIDDGALRGLMYTNENWLFGYATGAGKFDKSMLSADKALIERFYQNKGFAKANVCDIRVKELPSGDVELDYYIQEGKRYKIKRFSLPFDSEVLDKDVLAANLLEYEKPYCAQEVEATTRRLEYLFCKKGYLHAACHSTMTFDDEKGYVEVTFDVSKGERFTVRNIDFFGNHRTKDSVLRRELLFTEAALADRGLIDLTVERLKYIGLFESVDVQYREVSKGVVDVLFHVKERKHYNSVMMGINFGPGEGGVAGVTGEISLKKANFAGLGIDTETCLRLNEKGVSDANISFFNPSVGDRGVGLASGLKYTKHEYDEGHGLMEKAFGGQVSIFKSLKSNQYFRNKVFVEVGLERVSYYYPEDYQDKQDAIRAKRMKEAGCTRAQYDAVYDEHNKIKNVSQGYRFKKRFQDLIIGDNANAWVAGKYVLDNLDSKYAPTSGWSASASGKVFSGLLDASLGVKAEIDGAFYYPLVRSENLKIDFSAKARIGMVDLLSADGMILKKELYNVGGVSPNGIGMLRGFKFAEAGPGLIDPSKRYEKPYFIAAKKMATLNLEIAVPLGSSPTDPIAYMFYDIGCGWDGQYKKLAMTEAEEAKFVISNDFGLRHTCGIGFKLRGGMPIRFDWGYKLNRRAQESPSEVTLGMNIPF